MSELAAKAKPIKKEDKKEEKKEDKEDKKEDKKEEDKEEEGQSPATKPFGQCAGMNFTETKAERAATTYGEVQLSICLLPRRRGLHGVWPRLGYAYCPGLIELTAALPLSSDLNMKS